MGAGRAAESGCAAHNGGVAQRECPVGEVAALLTGRFALALVVSRKDARSALG